MLRAYLLIHLILNQIIHNRHYLFHKPIAASHHRTLDLLPAMRTLRFELEAPTNTSITIEFGAIWAHHRICCMTKTYMACKEILKLLPGGLGWMIERGGRVILNRIQKFGNRWDFTDRIHLLVI